MLIKHNNRNPDQYKRFMGSHEDFIVLSDVESWNGPQTQISMSIRMGRLKCSLHPESCELSRGIPPVINSVSRGGTQSLSPSIGQPQNDQQVSLAFEFGGSEWPLHLHLSSKGYAQVRKWKAIIINWFHHFEKKQNKLLGRRKMTFILWGLEMNSWTTNDLHMNVG